MRVTIKDIASHLPGRVVTNEELHAENPAWDMGLVEARSGVLKRHVAEEGETSLDLALTACEKLFSANDGLKGLIDCVIFCTQSPDYIMPPNACILHDRLGLPEDVIAFDFNLACSGYIYGLLISEGLIASGRAKNVLLVNAETYSKYINRQDRSARVLFGDGAAASWITASDTSSGIIDIQCSTFGRDHDKFIIPAGGCRTPRSAETALPRGDDSGNVRTAEDINMDGMAILAFVGSKIPKHVKATLARNNMTVDDVDLFVFHQASKMALDSLGRLLRIKPERLFRNLALVGNTVSASIPIALKDAMDKGMLKKGDKVLLCGFGVGLSWGTAIIEV